MFLLQRKPLQVVEDAAFCLQWLGFWRRDVKQRHDVNSFKANKKMPGLKAVSKMVANSEENLMTSRTMEDVTFTCQMVILSVKLFRDHFSHVKIDFGRMSSRFSEYLFQVGAFSATKMCCCSQ